MRGMWLVIVVIIAFVLYAYFGFSGEQEYLNQRTYGGSVAVMSEG